MRAKHVALVAAFAVLIVCGVLPLAAMLIASITVDGRISATAYSGLLASERQGMLLWNSFRLAASTAIGAAAIGVPLAGVYKISAPIVSDRACVAFPSCCNRLKDKQFDSLSRIRAEVRRAGSFV